MRAERPEIWIIAAFCPDLAGKARGVISSAFALPNRRWRPAISRVHCYRFLNKVFRHSILHILIVRDHLINGRAGNALLTASID
ncbi:hypothetical protein BC374_06675 [Ensifer sp. LC13]|nr:hypothetical protein BC362_23495 [Ensifer sp. LC14]OCP03652.1 hypothetical protein BC374_06675 [Ensifer sp. LC13]OCP34065.1 hypothetical protein BC364_14165 [Ensifer sp. LC499]